MEPVTFGKYTLLRRLAHGGMADLFVARSAEAADVERMVVVKLVASRFARDRSFATMFRDEVRIAATLTHPNIGQVFEVGAIDGRYYLAMEYLHGKDLRAIVQQLQRHGRRGLPPEVAVNVGARICSALQYAHDACGIDGQPLHVIHRDVSPSNVMVTYGGNVKLLDFGIAKAANRTHLTQPGTVKGKVRYLSPEQLLGQDVDHRTDIFTLGVTLWESTVGRHLFEGSQDVDVYEAIASGAIRRPSTLIAEYPPGLEAIVLRALSFNADARYASAREMQSDLERFAMEIGAPLSDIQVSTFMHSVFEDEVERWERARQSGKSLLKHLLEASDDGRPAPADLVAADDAPPTEPDNRPPPEPLERVLAAELADEPSQPAAAPDRPAKAGAPAAARPAPPAGERRRTAFYGSGPAAEPRRTVMYGSNEAEAPRRTVMYASPGPAPSRPAPARGAQGMKGRPAPPPVAPDGGPKVPRRRTGPSPAQDRPAAAGALRVTPSRPVEVTADGQAQKGAIERQPSAELRPTVAPDQARVITGAYPPPVITPPDGEAAPAEDETKKPAEGGLRADPTGDWAFRSSDEVRPGTHPYFMDGQATYVGRDVIAGGRRRSLLLLGATLGALLLAGGGLYFFVFRGGGHLSPPSGPGSAAGALVKVLSKPAGATVYSAADGQELGKTPLTVDRARIKGGKLQLHLAGYQPRTVAIGDRDRIEAVLAPAASRPATPATAPAARENAVTTKDKRAQPGRRKRRAKHRRRRGSELKEQF